MAVEPQPCPPGGGGGPVTVEGCCSPALAATGVCLADGTPIAVLSTTACGDCGDPAGAPTVVGWLNLTTGAFTAGPPPAGVTACAGQPQQFQVGQWCDLDAAGEVIAPVLVAYEYDENGQLVGVRTLTPAGDPYTVMGTLGLCPASGSCQHCEPLLLCDTGPVTSPIGPIPPGGNPLPNGVSWSISGPDTLSFGTRWWRADNAPATFAFSQEIDLTWQGRVSAAATMTMPAGTQVVAIHPNHAYDPATRVLSALPAAVNTDASTFRMSDVSSWTAPTGVIGGAFPFYGNLDVTAELNRPFLRTICRDCDGAVVSTTDTELDGSTPYTLLGEAGQCSPAADVPEPCRNSSTLLVCDLPAGGEPDPTVTDTDPTPYENAPGYDQLAGGAATVWSGGTLAIPPDNTQATDGTAQRIRTFAALVQAPRPGCDTGTATVTATVRVERTGPDPGCGGTGFFRLIAGATILSADGVTPAGVPVGTVQTLTVTGQVPAADLAAGNIALFGGLETYHRSPASCTGGSNPDGARIGGWVVDEFTAEVVYDQAGCETQILRSVTTDCETGEVVAVTDTTLDGQPYTVTGTVGQCQAAPSAEPCAVHVVERCRCDDTDGDGIADASYVELVAVDCGGLLSTLGTYLPDLSGPYVPVVPIDCDAGAAPTEQVTGVRPYRVVLAAGASWTLAAQGLLVQSVTVTALDEVDAQVTTEAGPSILIAGETATWSVIKDHDHVLYGPLIITAQAGRVAVTWTEEVTS